MHSTVWDQLFYMLTIPLWVGWLGFFYHVGGGGGVCFFCFVLFLHLVLFQIMLYDI